MVKITIFTKVVVGILISNYLLSPALLAQDANHYLSESEIKFQKGEFLDALSIIESGMNSFPENEWLVLQASRITYELNGEQEALMIAKSALRINPQNSESHSRIALFFSYCGQMDSAFTHYQLAIDIEKDLNKKCIYILNRAILYKTIGWQSVLFRHRLRN